MPPLSPQARFLLRGSAFIFLFLTAWWFLFRDPLLSVLHTASEISGSLLFGRDGRAFISPQPSGDWSLRVPIEANLPNPPPQTGFTPVHSLDFDLKRTDALIFTFGLPVLWALLLAAPRRALRPLLYGTLLMLAIEVLLFLVFAQISARNILAQLANPLTHTQSWPLRFADYLTLHVAPFLTPFLAALAVHPALRAEILKLSLETTQPPPSAPHRSRR